MKKTKLILLTAAALILSTLPPILATLSYFPLWQNRGSAAALSGFALVLLLICASPIFKLIRRIFESPSVMLVWLFIFLAFFALKSIADEVTVIAFVGFISNTVSAFLFKIAKRYR